MITSTSNLKIKHVRRLLSDRRFRQQEQAYVVEGTRWLRELVQFEMRPRLLLATREWIQDAVHSELLENWPGTALVVSKRVMAHASSAESPPGILAEVPMSPLSLPNALTLLLILDQITNPGNLGAMLRTAAAAGADGVVLAPGCVDAYNPKVLQGGMGAHLRVPVMTADWAEIEQVTKRMTVWLAAVGSKLRYYEADWRRPSALIIGGEAAGAGTMAQRLAQDQVSIPMYRSTESLNAAVAAGIILFEAARQRALY